MAQDRITFLSILKIERNITNMLNVEKKTLLTTFCIEID